MNACRVKRQEYLARLGQSREIETIERILLGLHTQTSAICELTRLLHWYGAWSWYAVRIPRRLLVPHGLRPKGIPLDGDVDLMGGPLPAISVEFESHSRRFEREFPDVHPAWWSDLALRECLANGQLVWPPSLSEITAAEVKTSHLSSTGVLKGTHAGSVRRDFAQVRSMAQMGFDRVALLRVIVTDPSAHVGFRNGSEWFRAAIVAENRGAMAEQEIQSVPKGSFGELLLLVGSLAGGFEDERGAIGITVRREPIPLDHSSDTYALAIRRHIKSLLHDVFSHSSIPRSLPVIIRACPAKLCGTVFLAIPPQNRSCPACGNMC